jgi:hypothetical protein
MWDLVSDPVRRPKGPQSKFHPHCCGASHRPTGSETRSHTDLALAASVPLAHER